jgi:superfamily II DNA or RNA helicase
MKFESIIKSNSWKEFQGILESLNKKEKGNAFELLTKLFFKIDPVHQTYYDHIWLLSEVPQRDLEYLNLPSHDLGIDLIAKKDNEYHAIQCKYHSDFKSSVSFKEVATFISLLEGNKHFSQGYICSSASITSRNFNKIQTKPITNILYDTWQLLDESFFNQARNLLENKKVVLKPFQPKEHQEKALKEAYKHFIVDSNTRGKLIFPCGAGKSLTGFWLTEKLESKSTLISVPSLSLIKQTLDVYLREIVANGRSVKWLCICSDEGIGKEDDVVFKTANIGVPCLTDSIYIENWLLENKDFEKIIFTTYQSGRIIAEISKKINFTFDLGIFDEAHKTVGSDKKLFSHLLFDENIAIQKRVFMTATERFYAGSKEDVISMDDNTIYGKTFSKMSFKQAIESGLLTDYKVITIDIKKSEISEFIKTNNLVQLNDKWKNETEARSLASMLALRKAMKIFPIKNAVSFHSTISKAENNKELQHYITETYKYEPIDAYSVSGKLPTAKRNIIIQEFANSPKALITNARCLTEGVDVPNIDCIIFADPRKSKVDIVQALGRALRKKEGKDWGYVILPVIYNDETNEIDNENFNEILSVVRGLASNDERIIEYFKDKNDTLSSIKGHSNDQFQFSVISEFLNEEELSKELEIKLWEKLSQFNWLPFEEARKYVQTLGIKSTKYWSEYSTSESKHYQIPRAPAVVYKDKGWLNWGDWLGTFEIAPQFRGFKNFNEAREFVHKLNVKNQSEWRDYCNSGSKPKDIPSNPSHNYKNEGFKGYGDWLGTDTIANQLKEYRDFNEAREYVRELKFKSSKDWLDFCYSDKKPKDIPKDPNRIYKNKGYLSMKDWLGTKIGFTGDYLSFEKAKEFSQNLNLNNYNEWKLFYKSGKIPSDIPYSPRQVYQNDGWISMNDWLGTGITRSKSPKKIRNFIEAREFVRNKKINNSREFKKYCKSGDKPEDIPSTPNGVYKDNGWNGWKDFLGNTEVKESKYIPYKEANIIVKKLGLVKNQQWRQYCKSGAKLDSIPNAPNYTYKNKGWISWGEWLGTGAVADKNKQFSEFASAREFVHRLKLKNQKEWYEYSKSGLKPDYIPSNPHIIYKNKGWQGSKDFLGKEED